jgi:hypothetical protein
MTEGNFVDYVKIFVSSEKEEKDLRICIERNLLKKVDRMDGRGGHVFLGNKGLDFVSS